MILSVEMSELFIVYCEDNYNVDIIDDGNVTVAHMIMFTPPQLKQNYCLQHSWLW